MSTNSDPIVSWPTDTPRAPEVQQEIETFLGALSSYPERFARNPYLTFEQHLFSVVTAHQYMAHLESD
jgi:hypothetical protein